MGLMSKPESSRKCKIFSRIVWWLAIITAAVPLTELTISYSKIILSNLFDWRPLAFPVPPVEDIGVEWTYFLLWLLSFLVSFVLSAAYMILAGKIERTSRAVIPIVINFVTLFLIMKPVEWKTDLDFQTNWKRREVVQMVEQGEIRSDFAKSLVLYEGGKLSDQRALPEGEVVKLPNRNFEASIELSSTYQHLARINAGIQVIRQGKVIAIYFPLYESSWLGPSYTGLLYQSNDIEPRNFGEERLNNVKRLRECWYQVEYDHSY